MNDSREDAKQLAARAMQEIESLEPGRQQKEEYDIYRRKVKGYEALTHQRPIEAYYTFKKLKEEVHADRDINKYYQISLEETRGVSYFIDEAEMTRTFPGIEQIVYIDRNPSLNVNEGETIVYIDNLVQDAGTFWAHGVEIMSLSDEMDTPSFHLQADYGKLVNNTLMLKGIYRDDPEKTLEPSFYSAEQLPEVSTVFTLTPSIVQLVRLSRQQDFLHQLNLPDLIQILLLLRLLKPFLFLILSILALGLGWRFRVKGNRFPWGLSWVIILLPFVVHMLLYLIEYAHQIVLSALVLNSGLSTGLVALVLIEALLLFLALLPVAMQKDL